MERISVAETIRLFDQELARLRESLATKEPIKVGEGNLMILRMH